MKKTANIKMEAVKGFFSHRVDRDMLKPGDHIYTWRGAFSYSHHGIYVGDGWVVHFTNKSGSFITSGSGICFSSITSPSSQQQQAICPTFDECGFSIPESEVVLSCLDCFLGQGSLYRYKYGTNGFAFVAKIRGGTCTTAVSDPPEMVIQRAIYLLKNGFGCYDVIKNNCEYFALYCKTGQVVNNSEGRSGQISFLKTVSVPVAVAIVISSLGAAAIIVGLPYSAGLHCLKKYKNDIGVRGDTKKIDVIQC